VNENKLFMKKEEFIKRTDDFIHRLENEIESIKSCREKFIDFDGNIVGGNEENLLGVMESKEKIDFLFHDKNNLFTKTIFKIRKTLQKNSDI
jgi:hypothetical protein